MSYPIGQRCERLVEREARYLSRRRTSGRSFVVCGNKAAYTSASGSLLCAGCAEDRGRLDHPIPVEKGTQMIAVEDCLSVVREFIRTAEPLCNIVCDDQSVSPEAEEASDALAAAVLAGRKLLEDAGAAGAEGP